MTRYANEPGGSRRSLFDDDDRLLTWALLCIIGLDVVVVTAITLAVGVPPLLALGIAAGSVGFIFVVLAAFARFGWVPWQRRYPAQPIADGAVSRSWESFGLGRSVKWNNCVRITVDARHIHVYPMSMLRWFGAERISLPLDRITNLSPAFWPGQMKARIDGHRIAGPAWALRLATDVYC